MEIYSCNNKIWKCTCERNGCYVVSEPRDLWKRHRRHRCRRRLFDCLKPRIVSVECVHDVTFCPVTPSSLIDWVSDLVVMSTNQHTHNTYVQPIERMWSITYSSYTDWYSVRTCIITWRDRRSICCCRKCPDGFCRSDVNMTLLLSAVNKHIQELAGTDRQECRRVVFNVVYGQPRDRLLSRVRHKCTYLLAESYMIEKLEMSLIRW